MICTYCISDRFPYVIIFFSRLLQYIGRETAPSPATGSKATHYKELKALLNQAMSL